MTKRQREQVVHLLRCAADLGMRDRTAPLSCASVYLGVTERLEKLANDAVDSFPSTSSSLTWPAFAVDCLEAAQRVSDGEWP